MHPFNHPRGSASARSRHATFGRVRLLLTVVFIAACAEAPTEPVEELPRESVVLSGVEVTARHEAHPATEAWLRLTVTFRNVTSQQLELGILGGPCRILPVFHRVDRGVARRMVDPRGRACPEPLEVLTLEPGESREIHGTVMPHDLPFSHLRQLRSETEVWVSARIMMGTPAVEILAGRLVTGPR